MFKPWLPLHNVDAWELGFVLDDGLPVVSIEARGGLVVAGGAAAAVQMLRPGEVIWKAHAPPPYDAGPVRIVAVEPRGARRHAVASGDTFTVFVKGEGADEIKGISATSARSKITHLAWGGTETLSVLYVLRDDHVLCAMKDDASGSEAQNVEPLRAIASDERGVLAMVTLSAAQPRVLVMPRGLRGHARALEAEIDPEADVQVAVADTAVALVVDGEYVLLSRTMDAPFLRVPALDLGDSDLGWRVGPIAFQGTSRDAALLCGRSEDDLMRIIRVDAANEAMSILEAAGTEIRDAPEILSLTWDASRQRLWGAASDVGIFRLAPPEAKGTKKVVLS